MEDKFYNAAVKVVLAVLICTAAFFVFMLGAVMWNAAFPSSSYSSVDARKVEDDCRAMIASYTSDCLMYEQYKNGSDEERSWAESAKIRANHTAAKYNEYYLKNYNIWYGNIPSDIRHQLEYIQ